MIQTLLSHLAENFSIFKKKGQVINTLNFALTFALRLACPFYYLGFKTHQYWLSSRKAVPIPCIIPCFVVGGLRAGGSGKTSVTLEIAQQLKAEGLRVLILAYAIKQNKLGNLWSEIQENTSWETCSEEALLLKQKSGVTVYVTRHRAKVWETLQRLAEAGEKLFDVIVCDDGLQDPRLNQAFRILLQRPQEKPNLWNLLPAGSYRQLITDGQKADLCLQGPNPFSKDISLDLNFSRSLIFPIEFDFAQTWCALCGLGNIEAFVEDLKLAGVKLQGILRNKNHGPFSYAQIIQAQKQFPHVKWLCTEKDAIKLQDFFKKGLNCVVIGQKIHLPEKLLPILNKRLAKPWAKDSILVH